MATVEIRNLSIGYKQKGDDKVIASRLNASLQTGELTCLLGPNGAGKSTLLRTLSAFQPQLDGDIIVMNRRLSEYKSSELARLVSVVLTDNSGIKNMTAYEVVAMGRSPYTGFWGKLTDKDKKVVDKCLTWVGITDLQDRKMQTLSDGEKQKVMIAKAIAQETPIIYLDEPTAFLDYPSKVSMMMLLHRLARALKKTIFLSTHDIEHALQIADQVWLLDKAKGLATGMPEDLSLQGKIEEYFLRDGLSYSRTDCSFSIVHETGRRVFVEGNADSLQYVLCKRAFERNGISLVTEGETDNDNVVVKVLSDGMFSLCQGKDEVIRSRNIKDVVAMTNSTIVRAQIKALES